jgi:hypothetical protein
MRSFRIDETVERSPIRAFELSEIDRANIKCLVGHTLARVECEMILQTLESYQGNRTNTASFAWNVRPLPAQQNPCVQKMWRECTGPSACHPQLRVRLAI